MDEQLFKRQTSKCYVQANSVRRPQKEHASLASKFRRLRDSSFIVSQQDLNELLFVAKASQESQAHIHCFARLAPPLYCQSANETELPVLFGTDRLEFGCGLNDLIHGGPPS